MQGEDAHVTANTAGTVDSKTPTGAAAEASSDEWIARLVEESRDENGKVDDEKLLLLTQEHLDIAKQHAERVRDVRDEAMVRQRQTGVSNLDLTKITGLSDSGISRRILAAGGKPRVNRRGEPNGRRTGNSGSRS
jgi:hypothetical protein